MQRTRIVNNIYCLFHSQVCEDTSQNQFTGTGSGYEVLSCLDAIATGTLAFQR